MPFLWYLKSYNKGHLREKSVHAFMYKKVIQRLPVLRKLMERCKKKQSASNQTSAEREGSEKLEMLIGAEPNELGIKLQQAHTLWDTVDQLQRTLLCLTLDS